MTSFDDANSQTASRIDYDTTKSMIAFVKIKTGTFPHIMVSKSSFSHLRDP